MKWERAEKMFAHSGLSLTEGQFHQFSTYQEILVETNRRMNLTTITEDAEVWRKHFLDSCLPFQYVEIPKGAAVIDVGTGAGFPGIPMRILRPDLRLTMLDSLQKRVHFLESARRCKFQCTVCMQGQNLAENSRIYGNNLTLRVREPWQQCRCCVNIACRL